jgi:uncharacterized protein
MRRPLTTMVLMAMLAGLAGLASAGQQGPTYDCAKASGQVETLICGDEEQQTDPMSAVITYGDDQVIAFAARSASGARYTADNMEFWEHQGEATVNWYGTMLTCKAVKP